MKILCLGLELPSFFAKENCLHCPVIAASETLLSNEQKKEFIEGVTKASHILLTSKSGVYYFHKHLKSCEFPIPLLKLKQFLAVGPYTAKKIEEIFGISGVYPQEYSQEGMVEMLKEIEKRSFVLFAKASITRDLVESFLKSQEIKYHLVDVYKTELIALEHLPDIKGITGIYFSSPSTVEGFLANFKEVPGGITLYFSGAVTAAHFKKRCLEKFNSLEKDYPLSRMSEIF